MADQLVTQVTKKTALEGAVRRRQSSAAQRPIGYQQKLLEKAKAEEKAVEETLTPQLHVPIKAPRARASSRAVHEKRPTAPFKDDHLLPPFASLKSPVKNKKDKSKMKCLVLDLDETLIHSSFKPVDVYDYMITIEIEDVKYEVYVAKRPGVDEFLAKMSACYEIVVFTASLPKYANPVIDLLDPNGTVDWRLFRASCTFVDGTYVKDMNKMGRDIKKTIIIDNSPHSFAFQPENAIPCDSWFDDQTDTELFDLIPILEGLADDSVENVIEELARLQINGIAAVEANQGGYEGDSSDDY